MGQRSKICTQQMFDSESETSESCIHPDHHFSTGNTSVYAERNIHPVLTAQGDTVGIVHQPGDHHERMFYGNLCNSIQHYHAIQFLGIGAADPSNSYNCNMLLAPPFGRNFPLYPRNVTTEPWPSSINQTDYRISLVDFARNYQLGDPIRGLGKIKNSELIPGINYNDTGSANSSFSTSYHSDCVLPQWGQSYEFLPRALDLTSFIPPQHGGRATLSGVVVSHRSIRNRSVSIGSHPETAFVPYQNCLLPGSYMTHPFQLANTLWVSQFGNGNNMGDGSSTWNYNNAMGHFRGSCVNSRPLQMESMNLQTYSDSSSGRNSAMLFHPSSVPNFCPPSQSVQTHSRRHPAHISTSYLHSVNNLHSINENPFSSGSVRILSSEDATTRMNLSELYEVSNAIDQLRDMRLDIDEMTYEELLALEEQIGYVETGLSEECITENMKTRNYIPRQTVRTTEDSSRLFVENETCTVCQVDYEENEIIATLDCGHNYHADCMKHWLLIKNMCPICKSSAIATKDRK